MRAKPRVAALFLAALAGCVAALGGGLFDGASAAADRGKNLRKAERALREGEFEAAEKIFREALERDKQDTAARLGLSLALLKQRKLQDAFDHAARVVAAEPMSPRAHALIGEALLRAGEFPLSIEEFRTALQFKSDEVIAVAGLGMVAFYENRLPEAIALLRRATQLDRGEPDYHFSLGLAAARSERYAEAADAYENFLRVAPRTDADRRARIRGLIDFLRYLGNQGDLLNAGGAARTVVPFEVVNNRPMMYVRVNGMKEPLRFVLDTGSGMCVVAKKTAERLGIKAVARGGTSRGVGGPGRFEIVYGFLSSLQVGDARVERVPVYLREFHDTSEAVDGYIGLSVLAKYLASIDYGARTLTLVRGGARPVPDPAEARPGVEIPIRVTSSGFWSGEVRIDGVEKPANFIIDTGATITVVSKALAERESLSRFERGERIQVYGSGGLTDGVQTLDLPALRFGPHAHTRVKAAVLDMDPINEIAGFEQTGILGGNVLKNFRVTFDFARAVVRLEPLAVPRTDDAVRGQPPVISNQP